LILPLKTRANIPNLGKISPIMGTDKTQTLAPGSFADALFPKVRQRVLAVFFGMPDRSFYASEVIALAHSGRGAVQRELAGLSEVGLLRVKLQGKQKHYQANAAAPIFSELRSLVLKTSGLADVVQQALLPVAEKIDSAFIYGSVARQEDTAQSDIDLMIVSATLGYADVFGALEKATQALGRKINPTLYTPADMAKRVAQDNAFVTRVLQQPKIWLIGNEELHHV
jgi:predicted nucleotidyltransferase